VEQQCARRRCRAALFRLVLPQDEHGTPNVPENQHVYGHACVRPNDEMASCVQYCVQQARRRSSAGIRNARSSQSASRVHTAEARAPCMKGAVLAVREVKASKPSKRKAEEIGETSLVRAVGGTLPCKKKMKSVLKTEDVPLRAHAVGVKSAAPVFRYAACQTSKTTTRRCS